MAPRVAVVALLGCSSLLRPSRAKELKYPEGVRPGDTISGTAGEYFRYAHVLVKPPDDEDRMESLRMAEEVKCRACEVLLLELLKRTESNSEDHIMDQLDGEMREEPELMDSPQENRVRKNRRGCNKHFKDELLLKGWYVGLCPKEEAPADTEGVKRPTWCLNQRPSPPTQRDVDTYSVPHEAAFYACEDTVGRYGQEMASLLAERLEDGGNRTVAVSAACREAAHCAGRPRKARAAGRKRRGKAASADL